MWGVVLAQKNGRAAALPSGHFTVSPSYDRASVRIFELGHRLKLILGGAEHRVVRIPGIGPGRRGWRGSCWRSSRGRRWRRPVARGIRRVGRTGISHRLIDEFDLIPGDGDQML